MMGACGRQSFLVEMPQGRAILVETPAKKLNAASRAQEEGEKAHIPSGLSPLQVLRTLFQLTQKIIDKKLLEEMKTKQEEM